MSRSTSTRLSVDDWVGAALELLGTEGTSAVKIDRLCGELGVTKGSFYWHFQDLQAFMEAVAERWADARDGTREAIAGLSEYEPGERLRRMMATLVDPDAWPLERATREWARTDEWVRERVAESDAWLFAEVRRAFLDLGFDKADATIRARALFYAGIGYIHTGPHNFRADEGQRDGLLEILTRR